MGLTIIDVTVDMVESASSRSNVVSPVALVLSTVGPYLNTVSMSDVSLLDLTLVDGTVIEYNLFLVRETGLVDQEIYPVLTNFKTYHLSISQYGSSYGLSDHESGIGF
jgi:hypothetical protein